MGFTSDSDIDVREVDDKLWELLHELKYEGDRDFFLVPSHMLTDFASVPRPFVWLIPTYGRYTKAAILHDYLCRDPSVSRLEADGLFRRVMRELGVAFLRRWFMWAGVRYGALLKKRDRAGWWKELPRVALFTVLALPIVLPPAVVIFAALLLFFVEELIMWGILQIGHLLKKTLRPAAPLKEVNPPKFHISL